MNAIESSITIRLACAIPAEAHVNTMPISSDQKVWHVGRSVALRRCDFALGDWMRFTSLVSGAVRFLGIISAICLLAFACVHSSNASAESTGWISVADGARISKRMDKRGHIRLVNIDCRFGGMRGKVPLFSVKLTWAASKIEKALWSWAVGPASHMKKEAAFARSAGMSVISSKKIRYEKNGTEASCAVWGRPE
jgi:hypothetical protein